ncbi:phenylacetate--CoA ligase [Cryptosporangium phraense]|uniref:Phenylacetate--CoA ligase n=1 Tax=Cryptosporangium phraense TaxID=2593070 RepID=A0A545AZ61_9ACTN|nr:phenylacetate--CoA ligase [Cryptosporangium phraense]TQS46627.1 phenylacetate--CoA ligase [Cryptosporangium phraense]
MLNLEVIDDVRLDELPEGLAGELVETTSTLGEQTNMVAFGSFV